QEPEGFHGCRDRTVEQWLTNSGPFGINILNINADTLPFMFFKLGPTIGDKYNIGYWAWELSRCPKEFELALNIVDEVWAISEFTAESFRSSSSVPVITMPHAVAVPNLESNFFTKSHYGLPQDKFVFFFTFDAASYLDRKNPIGV